MDTPDSKAEDPGADRGRPCTSGPGRALSRLEPWLLLLLAESPAHGYELLERLDTLPEAPAADRGHLYRTLRRLEEQELVTSAWHVPQAGPARHTYTLTADGLQALDAWAGHIRAALTRLEGFLERREALRATVPAASGRATEESPCGP
jgi:PadR family transcriptional regulator, regulatory protein PadR